MTKLNTKASASTGHQANQSSLNQAHDLSLLAPTIQADALKKRAIQANTSTLIGLIVDNYAEWDEIGWQYAFQGKLKLPR
jgi:hypothetical protein